MAIAITKESAMDPVVIGDFVATAFLTARFTGGKERAMVEDVRASDRYVPELTLVAVEGEELVGFVMLSLTDLVRAHGTRRVLNLGPLCTREDVRDGGLGATLVETVLARAAQLGHEAVFLAGNRDYYARFGFAPSSQWGINCQHDVPADLLDNIMGLELVAGTLAGESGTVYL